MPNTAWRTPVGVAVALIVSYVIIAIGAGAQAPGAVRQCADHRRHLRAHRAGLHDGLRHHRAHQLRPRRDLHGRRVRRAGFLLTTLGFTGADQRPGACWSWCWSLTSSCRCRDGPPRRRHRALRLPAAAERAAPGAADHRHRRVVHPPEHHPVWSRPRRRTVPQIYPGQPVHRALRRDISGSTSSSSCVAVVADGRPPAVRGADAARARDALHGARTARPPS